MKLDESEALREDFGLLSGFPARSDLLLVLAQVFQRQYRWYEAAQLQEEALQLASTRVEEANVRHHIGRGLFDEARYRDAAAEFQWHQIFTASWASTSSRSGTE